MKYKAYITALLLILVVALAFSCEQRVDIQRNFNFEISAEKFREDMKVGETKIVVVHIRREGVYNEAEYYASLFLREGTGTLTDQTDNVLDNNVYYKVNPEEFLIHYTAHQKGTHKIELTVKDTSGLEKEFVIDLSVEE